MRILFLLFCAFLSFSLSANSKRVLSTLPSYTESMYFLGAQDLLVGVSEYCNYPLEAKKLPRYGSSFEMSLERLVKEKVTTVLLARVQGARVERDLKKLGLEVIIPPYKKLNDSVEMLRMINSKLSLGKDKVIDDFERKLKLALNPLWTQKKVLLIIGETFKNGKLHEVRAIGSNNYFDEILKGLGGTNVTESEGYPIRSIENLLKSKFDLIIRISDGSQAISADWKKSLFKDKIRYISKNYAVVLGPRVLKLINEFKTQLR